MSFDEVVTEGLVLALLRRAWLKEEALAVYCVILCYERHVCIVLHDEM